MQDRPVNVLALQLLHKEVHLSFELLVLLVQGLEVRLAVLRKSFERNELRIEEMQLLAKLVPRAIACFDCSPVTAVIRRVPASTLSCMQIVNEATGPTESM